MSGSAVHPGAARAEQSHPTADHSGRSRARRLIRNLGSSLGDPGNALALLLLLALVGRAIWLWLPQGSLIFDESYYVNAARVMLGWLVPEGSPYAGAPIGLDPNAEHPPLGKALIALSMAVFGDSGIGWRMPSLIAAMAALLALYGIVRASGETARLGVLAVGLFAFDNLALVHGRIGTLDMMALAPILIGAWLALRGRWAPAGAACAAGTLVKLSGVFGLLALLVMQAVSLFGEWRRSGRLGFVDLRPTVLLVSAYAVVALSGLWLLDLRFSSYHDPWAHLAHMTAFGTSLQAPGGPTGIASNPWQWLVNEVQINYLRVAVDTSVNGKVVASQATIDFRGALNPALIGAASLAFPFAFWLAWRKGSTLAVWSVAWAAANYLPYYLMVLINHRITYIYYFLPVVPALAVAVALLLRRSDLPRAVTVGYLAAIVWGFLAYFPFRQLP